MVPVEASTCTMNRLASQATRLVIAASANKARRNTQSGLPNTFWVLILLIRIGVNEVLKFVKIDGSHYNDQ